MKHILHHIVLVLLLLLSISLSSQSLVEGKKLKKDSLLIDIDLLEKALTEIHPGVYRYNTPESMKTHFDELRSQIHEGMTEADFMKRLAQTAVEVRCGHTYVNPWNMSKEIRKRLFGGQIFFPIGFQILNEGFIVTHNASGDMKIKRGAKILSINGFSTDQIYDSLKTIAKYDGNNDAPTPHYLSLNDYRFRVWKAFDLYFPLFFPSDQSEYEIEYQNFGDSKRQKTIIEGLTKRDREQIMSKRYGENILENKSWSLDVINKELAIMRLGTFAIWNWKDFDQKEWFAEAFQKLDSLNIQSLAIDIRGNGGGLSEPKDELLSYLIKEEVKCGDIQRVLIRTTKVDSKLIPYCDTWNKLIIEGVPPKYYSKFDDQWYVLKEPSACQDLIPKENAYKGEVYFFGGPSNVSATYDLLYKANNINLGTYIGENSGGNQQGINGGEYIFFYMPYSQMEVDIPLKYFAPTQDRPDAGVAPEVRIEWTQADIAKDVDPYVEYVRSATRK